MSISTPLGSRNTRSNQRGNSLIRWKLSFSGSPLSWFQVSELDFLPVDVCRKELKVNVWRLHGRTPRRCLSCPLRILMPWSSSDWFCNSLFVAFFPLHCIWPERSRVLDDIKPGFWAFVPMGYWLMAHTGSSKNCVVYNRTSLAKVDEFNKFKKAAKRDSGAIIFEAGVFCK